MNYFVFDTNFARNNQDTLRWASIAVASVVTILCLLWAAMIWKTPTFNDDVTAAVQVNTGNYHTFRLILIALMFLTVISTNFLSWYVASLHMSKYNLMAVDVLNVLMSIAAFLYYKTKQMKTSASVLIGCSTVLMFVTLVVMLLSPTAAGVNGALVQSSLFVPSVVAMIFLMCH